VRSRKQGRKETCAKKGRDGVSGVLGPRTGEVVVTATARGGRGCRRSEPSSKKEGEGHLILEKDPKVDKALWGLVDSISGGGRGGGYDRPKGTTPLRGNKPFREKNLHGKEGGQGPPRGAKE